MSVKVLIAAFAVSVCAAGVVQATQLSGAVDRGPQARPVLVADDQPVPELPPLPPYKHPKTLLERIQDNHYCTSEYKTHIDRGSDPNEFYVGNACVKWVIP